MDFQEQYKTWLERHKNVGSAERRRRLHKGIGHAERTFLERVWVPVVGDLTYLHPEYEVADYAGNARFLDFAYLRADVKLAIEIDGYNTHVRNRDRQRFADDLHRQNLLTLDGWDILRFAYDDLEERVRRCQQTVQQYMGTRFAVDLRNAGHPSDVPSITAIDREIVRLARSVPRPITPADVCKHLGISRYTAYKHLKRLTGRRWLLPAGGEKRIRSYRLASRIRFPGL